MKWFRFTMILVAAVCAAATAHAGKRQHRRTTGRVYLYDEAENLSVIRFNGLRGWTGFEARTSRDEADRFHIRETLYSPELQLETSGTVYHEKFLTFNLSGAVSLERLDVRGDAEDNRTMAFNDYNASALLLKDAFANLSAFANRNNAWVDSPFRSSYRILSSNTGADFRTRSSVLPVTLSYSHVRREEDFAREDRIVEQRQFRTTTSQGLGPTKTDLSFRFVDYSQNVQFQEYKTVASDMNSTLRLGSGLSRVRSDVRYFHQYGTIRRRDLNVSEDAFVAWSENLEQTARYQFSNQTASASADAADALQLIRTHRGEMGLRHTLYGSLISDVSLYASDEATFDRVTGTRSQIGDLERKGVRSRLHYRRRTPIGRLNVGVGYEIIREDQSSENRERNVANEAHLLTDGDEPKLEHTGVDVASIVVTDDTGFIVYEEGVDYTVVAFGPFVRIFRVITGNIADGQSILVDYRFSFSPDLSFYTRGRLFNIRFDTSRDFAVYYRFNRHKDDFISGTPNGFLEDQRIHLAGVQWRHGAFSAGDEYEVNRLIATEFLTNRLHANYFTRLTSATRINVSTNYNRTRFTQTDRTLNSFLLSARVSGSLRGRISFEGDGFVRIDRGSPADAGLDSDFSGVRFRLTKRMGALTLETGASYRNADDNNIRDKRSAFFVSLRREF